jgi:putative SOS response-associated peptidase YedK
MCGKFTIMMTWGEYCARAGVGTDGGAGGPDAMDPTKVLGTLTPMSNVPILHLGPVRQRRITPMLWGWYNHKLLDPRRGFSHLHARSEDIDRTPTWVDPFHETRGIVLTKHFNIGEEEPTTGKVKQWVCSRADGEPVAIAVIYSAWELVQGLLRAFAMVTTESCAPLSSKDNRMPALLRDEEEIAMWLGEIGATGAELKALLRPYDGELVMREQDPPKKKQEGPPPKPKKQKPDSQPGFL